MKAITYIKVDIVALMLLLTTGSAL